jgi:hypothetical protein
MHAATEGKLNNPTIRATLPDIFEENALTESYKQIQRLIGVGESISSQFKR